MCIHFNGILIYLTLISFALIGIKCTEYNTGRCNTSQAKTLTSIDLVKTRQHFYGIFFKFEFKLIVKNEKFYRQVFKSFCFNTVSVINNNSTCCISCDDPCGMDAVAWLCTAGIFAGGGAPEPSFPGRDGEGRCLVALRIGLS